MNMKVSVVIPTRDRPETLKHALRTVIAQSHRDLEIIVSDNASRPATRAVVEEAGDARIRYLNTGQRVSMTENFEFALEHATGEWISVLGDDDGLLPTGIERALNALETTGAPALASSNAAYLWPAPENRGPDMYLSIPIQRGYEMRNARAHMRRMLNAEIPFTKSPMLYTGGVVSRALYGEIKAKSSGRFFRSQIPDVYSAFAVCSMIDQFVFMREPIMVSGISQFSTGNNLDGAAGLTFQRENSIPLHSDLALAPGENVYPMLPALVYESYLQSKFLRDNPLDSDPAHQLDLMMIAGRHLAKSSEHWTSFWDTWPYRFATHHNFAWHAPAVGPRRPDNCALAERRERWRKLTEFYRVDRSLGLPYANVYDAAVITEDFIKRRPSFAGNVLHSLARKLRARRGWAKG